MRMKIICAAILAVLVSAGALAASSGDLVLTGTVAAVSEITVTPEAVASSLDLTTRTRNMKVASVNEKSNSATGYKVTVSAASITSGLFTDPALTGNGPEGDVVEYKLKYDGRNVNFRRGDAVITNNRRSTGSDGVDKEVTISYSGSSTLDAGTYTDTLTFTIEAK